MKQSINTKPIPPHGAHEFGSHQLSGNESAARKPKKPGWRQLFCKGFVITSLLRYTLLVFTVINVVQ